MTRLASARVDSGHTISVRSALLVGLAYVAGHAVIACPAFPPIDVTDRIAWLAAIATVLAALEAAFSGPAWLQLAGRAVLLAIVIGTMLGPLIALENSWSKSAGWIVTTSVVCALAWLNLWALERSATGADAQLALSLTAAIAAPVLFLSGSVVLGALSMVLAASLTAFRLLGGTFSPGASVLIGTSVFTALVVEGLYYASLPIVAALCFAAAPACAWISRSKLMSPRSALAKTVVLILMLFILGAIAFVMAYARAHPH